jgi:hypothetical protein
MLSRAQVLVPADTDWRFLKGFAEASSPDAAAWRALTFSDAGWTSAPAPFWYGDAQPSPGTWLTDMRSNYTSIFLRKTFVLANPHDLAALHWAAFSDDGCIAWLNGHEIGRFNMPAGEITYDGTSLPALAEPIPWWTNVVANARDLLLPGTNVLAVHAFNTSLGSSSDFVLNAALYATPDIGAPQVTLLLPAAGAAVRQLTTVEVGFDEPVNGVEAADLLLNGSPATNVTAVTPSQFVFRFPQPATGIVQVAWTAAHGIRDWSSLSNRFTGGSWSYDLNPNLPRTDVFISEFLAANSGDLTNSLRDELGNSPDWIEIYNNTDDLLSLTGWFLTDNAQRLTKWKFPATVLPAHSYLVVFASDRNTNVAGRLHTNFKLSAGGSFLALVDPATNVVSAFAPAYPPQFTDVSYGRDPLDPSTTGYYTNATPGAANATRGQGFAPEVIFSRVGGTFTSAFTLVLSTADTNCDIRYVIVTNNVPSGSLALTNLPTASSPLYTAPFLLSQTAQVRARAFPRQAGVFAGPPRTECYVQLSAAAAAFTSDLPIVLLHNLAGGTVPSTTDQSAIVMVFEPAQGVCSLTNPPTLVTRAGMNLRGRSTGSFPKGSFALETWDEYNQDRNVEFCGLPEESDWVLYAPNCFDLSLMHNPLMHQLSRDLGWYSPRTRFAEVFLNTAGGTLNFTAPAGGNYHGLYVIEEKIKRGKDRVDVDALEPEQTNAPAVTGGYITKFDSTDPDERSFLAGGITPGPDGGATEIYVYPSGPEMVSPLRTAQNTYLTNCFNALYAALHSPSWTNPVSGYAQHFDVAAGIDHHLLNVLALNVDGFRLSGYLHKPRDGRITMGPLWDLDRALGTSRNDGRPFNARSWRGIDYDGSTDFFNPSVYYNNAWYHRMFNDPDFWQRYLDRYQELRADQWSTNRLFALVDSFANQVRAAQPREVSRWRGRGNSDTTPRTGVVTSYNYSYDFGAAGTYQVEVDFQKRWLADRLDFMDTNFLARPVLSHSGGAISNGFTLTIAGPAKPGSRVYYTLDGSDPRAPGGGLAAGARAYAGSLVLTNNARVVARARNFSHQNLTGPHNPPLTSPWSGVVADTYLVSLPTLAITELMYHPAPPAAGTNDADDFEFIELKNVGTQPLNLVGVRFTNGIQFAFTAASAMTNLGPGQYVVLAADTNAFRARYPSVTNLAGQYAGRLDNSGERLQLEGPLREPIADFSFDDDWLPTTDGLGFSLVLRGEGTPAAAWGNGVSWRTSTAGGGSPGRADTAPADLPVVVINEALTHTDLPQVDSVELRNLSPAAANIGGWFLSDDAETPRKYRIPANTLIPAGGFLTISGTQFGSGPDGFGLSALGDEAYLFSGDGTNLTGYRHGFEFGAQANGIAFGRLVTSTGEERFTAQMANTPGAPNSRPLVGPMIINEVMFNPPPYGVNNNTADEFIELRNLTAQPALLFDPEHPANTWQLDGGASFKFPTGATLAPLAHALVVNFDPAHDPVRLAWFRNLYAVTADTPIFGPYAGNLDNSGERIGLYRPDVPQAAPAPDAGFVPYVLVDEVRYSPGAPWPAGADGTGNSLQRVAGVAFGDDPINWQSAAPTAGQLNAGALAVDTDLDGLPDEWELAHGLDPGDPNGANGPLGDPDGDGANNLQEQLAGTDPGDARSRFAIESISLASGVTLVFQAVSNRTYTVQFTAAPDTGAWQKLFDVSARPSNRLEIVTDAAGLADRFYRVVTPQQP